MVSRPGSFVTVVVLAAVVSGCGESSADGVDLPGVGGVPRSAEVEGPPPLPTTTSPVPESDESSADPTGAVDDTTGDSTSEADATTTTSVGDDDSSVDDGGIADPAAVAEPAPTTTAAPVFLRRGDEGPAVASMQRRLIALDYLATGGDTGVFDGATADALIDFQAQYGLIVDGIFGPQTDRALNAATASVAAS